MRWLKCSLLVTALCAAYGQDSATQTDAEITRKNAINFQGPKPAGLESTDILGELTANGDHIAGNSTAASIQPSDKEVQIMSKPGGKEKVENMTFNDLKPFLLFPILPFLFPPREEENLKREILSSPKNDTSKNERSNTDVKPFIFFDFAFNIRRIPINNVTYNTNDSEVVNMEKLGNANSIKQGRQKSRRRRHTKRKAESPAFFDDPSLFPDSEFDEFLPKPDLFFPDLPFHHKPLKKLSRRKRDQDKPELKSDLKSFFDAFDEAFMQTKNELEWADPILNFFRGGEKFDEEKKGMDDLFNQPPDIRGKPSMKFRIQRNIKRLNNEHQDGLIKTQDSPTIIVDKVVKIGEFHVHDKNKSKRKDSKGKFLGRGGYDETASKESTYIPIPFKHGDKRKKRNHFGSSNSEGQTYTKIQTEEIRLLPKPNASLFSAGGKFAGELKQRENQPGLRKTTSRDETTKYENLMKVIDSLKDKINVELSNNAMSSIDTLKRSGSGAFENLNSKKVLREDLRKNITELLNEFLSLVKNLDATKMVERPESRELDNRGIFNFTERESLLEKTSRARLEKKDGYFEDEYSDLVKHRQVADLNYLFLGVTVPTVLVFTLVMLTCFYSLQVKGKICAKLFKTRQVFLVDNETASQLTTTTNKKIQPLFYNAHTNHKSRIMSLINATKRESEIPSSNPAPLPGLPPVSVSQ